MDSDTECTSCFPVSEEASTSHHQVFADGDDDVEADGDLCGKHSSSDENSPLLQKKKNLFGSNDSLFSSSGDELFPSDKAISSTENVPSSTTKVQLLLLSDQSSQGSSTISTRRNSTTNSTSDLGTPLNILFRSRSSSTISGERSNTGTPYQTSESSIIQGLDRLLNRITSERFLELRRIQVGERPVTNGDARSNLETFFQRALNGPTEEQRSAEEEANRPENVANDVQSLLQLSRVRSALQSGFGTTLESTLNFQRQPVASLRSPRRSNQSNRHSNLQLNQQQTPRQLNVVTRNNTTSIVRPNAVQADTEYPPPPTEAEMRAAMEHPSPLQSTLDASFDLLAENIATDITRLQSLQVVSTMLRTDFRSELETLVQSRVETAGNGESVAQIIRSLPRTTRRPQANQMRSSSHNGSITPDTPRHSEEIRKLQQQLNEMKLMMSMSMEVQLDTQRAIRQEVSAVFTAFMQDYLLPSRAGQPSPTTQSNQIQSRPIQAGKCVICLDKSVDTVLYQCGHMCVCHPCGLQLKMNEHKCPMCRAPIRDVIRAYKTQENSQ